MSRKTKEEAEKTRSRILSSALKLFVKKGYENTTFNDIAAKLNMTKGAIYWHFDSKSDLLSELLREAMRRFSEILAERMLSREMTYPEIAQMLVESAERIVSDKRRADFFMLMQTGLKWTDANLAAVAKRLIDERVSGPYQAVVSAVEADLAAGRVLSSASPHEVASSTIALWDGLIRRKIEGFLETDMIITMQRAFDAFWASIRIR